MSLLRLILHVRGLVVSNGLVFQALGNFRHEKVPGKVFSRILFVNTFLRKDIFIEHDEQSLDLRIPSNVLCNVLFDGLCRVAKLDCSVSETTVNA